VQKNGTRADHRRVAYSTPLAVPYFPFSLFRQFSFVDFQSELFPTTLIPIKRGSSVKQKSQLVYEMLAQTPECVVTRKQATNEHITSDKCTRRYALDSDSADCAAT